MTCILSLWIFSTALFRCPWIYVHVLANPYGTKWVQMIFIALFIQDFNFTWCPRVISPILQVFLCDFFFFYFRPDWPCLCFSLSSSEKTTGQITVFHKTQQSSDHFNPIWIYMSMIFYAGVAMNWKKKYI